MPSSFRRCRTGLLVLAGALIATGSMARETRGLRSSDTTLTPVLSNPVLSPELPSLQVEGDLLYQRLKGLGAEPVALVEPMSSFVEALEQGRIDDTAIWLSVAAIPDVQMQAKAETILRDFADRRLQGLTGLPLMELPEGLRPAGMTEIVELPEVGDRLQPKALCNTCTTASAIATPTLSCQYVSGNTTTSCPSDFYQTTLTAGQQYTFTTCSSICPSAGATGSWDTRIIIRQAGSCAILVNNDDFCGLQSRAIYTPTVTGTYIIEVTGFTASNVGSYTMGYVCAPPCASCTAPRFTGLVIDSTCRTHCSSVNSCQDNYYAFNLVAGQTYTWSTCQNLPSGCTGTGPLDTVLELRDPSCIVRATNDDATGCSNIRGSVIQFTPTVSGTWTLRVRGFGSQTGNYCLAYRQLVGCQGVVVTNLTPTTGSTNQTNCSFTQTFTVSTSGTVPLTGTFTITPPAGGSASPSSGSVTYSGNTGTFSSTLTKPACGSGNFTVTATASNSCSTASRTITYTLSDRTAPTFTTACPASTTIDCRAPVPPAPTMRATDNCDPNPTVTFTETSTPGSCPGNRTIRRTWTARDCNGNTRTCTQTISVRDTTPPTVSGVDERCLYPPNHEYHCYGSGEFRPTVTDDCSPPTTLLVVGCTSDEPDEGTGDGDFPNDCIVSPNGQEICVRSERAGNLNDRHYTILGVAVDACGNRSAPQPIAVITVPHDDNEHPECDTPNSGLEKHF